MKCPMFETAMGTDGKIVPIEFLTRERECLKEECACWNEEVEQCDPTGLILHIKSIDISLAMIVGKMPHANQFTK